MLPICASVVAAFAPPATGRPWSNIGPKNIGDDVHGRGEAGTIGPAVSKDVVKMYMGGNNNAASSGVLKSLDGGMHWTKVSAGLTDTRLLGLFIVDDAADHVLAGTPSGLESLRAVLHFCAQLEAPSPLPPPSSAETLFLEAEAARLAEEKKEAQEEKKDATSTGDDKPRPASKTCTRSHILARVGYL